MGLGAGARRRARRVVVEVEDEAKKGWSRKRGPRMGGLRSGEEGNNGHGCSRDGVTSCQDTMGQ